VCVCECVLVHLCVQETGQVYVCVCVRASSIYAFELQVQECGQQGVLVWAHTEEEQDDFLCVCKFNNNPINPNT